ncbi:NhaA family Na+:H+ antiporter [Stenotrophomonas rhizophila]|uniref:Na(+)/H(+) antiporter NhaA n=2 Tax=Lysobacteraceae TaxID=32033 RepID=A0AAW5PI04_9GAMM|nr:NhaA family Na+:H+ antiporter [Stenotrophomonas rhizophila]
MLANEASAGVALMMASMVAILLANSPAAGSYFAFLHAYAGPVLSEKLGPMTPHLWINDGLMAIFFLLVGLEIKRELISGRLSSWQQRRLPAVPALLGMALPALIFLTASRHESSLSNGWAIPAATDIAFAVGVLALLGRHAPASLKLLLLSVAIIDDMGAVAIIALFYTSSLDIGALAAAIGAGLAMYALKINGVKRLWPYLVLLLAMWYATLLSGVHATIAGVVGAFLIPYGASAKSPLVRLEHGIAPWVGFVIVPIFGFANAGVDLSGISMSAILAPLPLGIAAGLFVGKQIGVFGGVALAVKTGLAEKPAGASWLQIYGVSLLCGIGFTMSLFISSLAFPLDPAFVEDAKVGILLGSLLSALLGAVVLRFAPRT